MKLEYNLDKFDRAIGAVAGVDFNERHVSLNQSELAIIQQALDICSMADTLYRGTLSREDNQENEFGWAGIYLLSIVGID